jgi:hypothetical protein
MNKAPIVQGHTWHQVAQVPPKRFTCGYCGALVASDRGWFLKHEPDVHYIRICPMCQEPNCFSNGVQVPGVALGSPVKELPTDIGALYHEARISCSATAYTGAVLLLRKLLMNIAVNLGAPAGAPFVEYVEFLAKNGYVPPNGKGWVDHIRKKGNDANHEIALMGEPDAKELIVFSEMLLKFIYEFPTLVPQPPLAPSPPTP